jgi:hypothetical protein
VLRKLLFGEAAHLEEVRAEPDLFYVRLVVVLSADLFDSELLFGFFVLAQPYQRETATPEQFDLLEGLGEPIAERFELLCAQIVRVIRLATRLALFKDDIQLLSGITHFCFDPPTLFLKLLNRILLTFSTGLKL